MKIRFVKILLVVLCFISFSQRSEAISFNIDSIAKWGKFAKFCVDTYYWGDRFFNTYDTAYVQGTGKKFNIKLTSQSWIDSYRLNFEPESHIDMLSNVASNAGIHLTYLAVSIGYDMNINKFTNGYERSRKRVNFGFNCALFSAEFYIQNNDLTTKINHLETPEINLRPRIKFDGMKTDRWGFDVYYFFNNKRYSQAAAFSYSRLQLKSQGSWYLGISYCNQKYDFDFTVLPTEITDYLPADFADHRYLADTHTYALKGGYAYNWVPGNHWLVSVSESPIIGYRTGKVNSFEKNCMSISNMLRCGAVYNLRNLFIGLQASLYTNFAKDQASTLIGNVFQTDFSIGYRFNLW